jgi:ABC-type nitrate/sulfonate/bicarbonate transport system substrate-binding protein
MAWRHTLRWCVLVALWLGACGAPAPAASKPSAADARGSGAPTGGGQAASAPAGGAPALAQAAGAAAASAAPVVPPQLDPPQTVRFSYTQIAAETPVYLAIEHGYFKELGVNAELIPMTNATETMPMLTADQLDFGSQAISPAFFNAVARGVGIRMVGDRGSNIVGRSTVSLAIRKDIVDGLPWTGFQNLKGLKIAVSGPGIELYYLERFLQLGGLGWDDIDIASPFSFPDMAAGLTNKALDGAVFNEPLATQLEQFGTIQKVSYADTAAPGWHTSGILFGEPFAERTQLARNAMVGWLRGVRHYWDAYDGRRDFQDVVDMLVKYTPVKDEALIRKVPPTGQNPEGYLDPQKIATMQDWYIGHGLVTQRTDLSKAVDMSFVDYATSVLGPYEPVANPRRPN